MLARRLPLLPYCRRHCCRFLSSTRPEYGEFIPAIGLEIHAQVRSDSKLFSSSPTTYSSPPNANVSLFDAGLPGTLPLLNKHCLLSAIRTGLALNCSISSESSFDRKHYFYADLPLGYQITQHWNPIARNGHLDFVVYNKLFHKEPYVKRCVVHQLQLEQDSGKTLHDEENDVLLIDLNRAGNPLIEIVFSPDLNDGEEAAALVRDLILLLKGIDTCACKLEEGTLRVDANVSIRHEEDTELGTRTEIKNLNSLKSISRAIDYEIRRQSLLLRAGQQVVNETMRFDSALNETQVMRDKSDFADYRFMPEANLPMISLKDSALGINMQLEDAIDVNEFRKEMPDSPQEQRRKMMLKYGINLETAMRLLTREEEKELFCWIMDDDTSRKGDIVFRVLFAELIAALEACEMSLSQTALQKQDIASVCDMVQRDEISFSVAQDLMSMKARKEARSPHELVQDYGWSKITDPEIIRKKCEEAIEAKRKRSKEAQKGKKYAFDVLVQYVMSNTSRRVDQELVERMLIEILKPPDGTVKSGKERRAEKREAANE